MTKTISVIITLGFLIMTSSCTTYNSLVPDFATIGSSSASESVISDAELAKLKSAYDKALIQASKSNMALRKAKEAYDVSLDESTWWNPISWF